MNFTKLKEKNIVLIAVIAYHFSRFVVQTNRTESNGSHLVFYSSLDIISYAFSGWYIREFGMLFIYFISWETKPHFHAFIPTPLSEWNHLISSAAAIASHHLFLSALWARKNCTTKNWPLSILDTASVRFLSQPSRTALLFYTLQQTWTYKVVSQMYPKQKFVKRWWLLLYGLFNSLYLDVIVSATGGVPVLEQSSRLGILHCETKSAKNRNVPWSVPNFPVRTSVIAIVPSATIMRTSPLCLWHCFVCSSIYGSVAE